MKTGSSSAAGTRGKRLFSTILFPLGAIAAAFIISGIIIAALGFSPAEALRYMLMGAFGSTKSIGETLVKMCPLIYTGLAFALANRCGLVNIGAEGQLYMGGLFASIAGIYITGLPAVLHLPITILAGFLGGGMWGLLAGWLKVRFGASEIITTIMLNYIAIYAISFAVSSPMKEPPGTYPQSMPIRQSATLPILLPGTRLHLGFVLALVCILLYYLFLWRLTTGYETRLVGHNAEAARYCGMVPKRNILLAMFLSGGFGGLAGVCEILGIQLRLFADFSPGYGYDGIAIALLGQNNPIGILLSSFLFGVLRSGASLVQQAAQVPLAIIYIMQALIIIFVSGKYVVQLIAKRRRKEVKADAGTNQ